MLLRLDAKESFSDDYILFMLNFCELNNKGFLSRFFPVHLGFISFHTAHDGHRGIVETSEQEPSDATMDKKGSVK